MNTRADADAPCPPSPPPLAIASPAAGPVRVVEALEWLATLHRSGTAVTVQLGDLPADFRPPREWRTPPQTASDHLIVGVVRGTFAGWAAGEPFRAEADTLLWVGPGVPCDFRRENRRALRLLRLHLRVADPGDGAALRLPWPYFLASGAGRAFAYLRELGRDDEAQPPDLFRELRVRNLVSLLSLEIFARENGAGRGSHRLLKKYRERLRRAAFTLPVADWRPTPLAAHVGLAPTYFRRVFRRTFGMPPRQWLREERLREAARLLLETDLEPAEIARRVGSRRPAEFAGAFGALYGCSPAAFRDHPPAGI